MFRRLVVALSVILATGVFVSAEARKQRYDDGERLVVISEQDIDLSLDKYSIDVGKAKGAYKAIRVRNAQGRLFDLQRVQIVYSDGSVHNEDRQIDVAPAVGGALDVRAEQIGGRNAGKAAQAGDRLNRPFLDPLIVLSLVGPLV